MSAILVKVDGGRGWREGEKDPRRECEVRLLTTPPPPLSRRRRRLVVLVVVVVIAPDEYTTASSPFCRVANTCRVVVRVSV